MALSETPVLTFVTTYVSAGELIVRVYGWLFMMARYRVWEMAALVAATVEVSFMLDIEVTHRGTAIAVRMAPTSMTTTSSITEKPQLACRGGCR
jgi:hypothetical protein